MLHSSILLHILICCQYFIASRLRAIGAFPSKPSKVRAMMQGFSDNIKQSQNQFTCKCITYEINLCFQSNSAVQEANTVRIARFSIDLNSDSTEAPIIGDDKASKSTNEDTLTVGLSLQINHGTEDLNDFPELTSEHKKTIEKFVNIRDNNEVRTKLIVCIAYSNTNSFYNCIFFLLYVSLSYRNTA